MNHQPTAFGVVFCTSIVHFNATMADGVAEHVIEFPPITPLTSFKRVDVPLLRMKAQQPWPTLRASKPTMRQDPATH